MTHICLQNSLVRTGYTFLPHHKEDRKSNPTLCLEGKGGNHKNAANSPTDNHDAFEKHCPAQRDGWTVRGRQEPGGRGDIEMGPTWGATPGQRVGPKPESSGYLSHPDPTQTEPGPF